MSPIHFGHFLSHTVRMPAADSLATGGPIRYVEVIKTEEKGSDVNLATHLLHDAHEDRFELGIVVSNDSDLIEPIRIVRNDLHKRIGLLNPQKHPSVELSRNVDFVKNIRQGVVRACQFPHELTDIHGTFHKPDEW